MVGVFFGSGEPLNCFKGMRDSLYHLCGNVSRLSGSLADPRASFGSF